MRSWLPEESRRKRRSRFVLATVMTAVGVLHFARPEGFVKIVPSYLPSPVVLVWVSGLFEILGGLGLVAPRVHRLAALGLVALFVAVFPANINMAMNEIQVGSTHIPAWLLWLRLPFQAALVAWAWWLSRSPSRGSGALKAGSSVP